MTEVFAMATLRDGHAVVQELARLKILFRIHFGGEYLDRSRSLGRCLHRKSVS